jgi:TolA-binding protein
MKSKTAGPRICLGFALALAACAPAYGDAYLAQLAAGRRAYHAGRYVEAARAYDEAAAKALRVKDRDEARFMQARSFERAERWREAEDAYRRLVADSPRGPRAPRAAFDIAELEIKHGDEARGWRLLEEAADRYPNHGLCRPSLRRLIEHIAEQGGEPQVQAFLSRKTSTFRGTDQEQTVAYEIALSLDRAGQKVEAHDAFVATARAHPYPKGGLTDDALVRAARIDEELGRDEEAVRHLRDLLRSREVSSGMGSYERPRYAEAQLLIGEIYRDKIKDHAAARREFAKVCEEHPTSVKCDDAAWAEGKLAHADGDRRDACRVAMKFVKELSESRYAPCARLLCPSAPAAKRECPDYIARDFRGEDSAPRSSSTRP